MRCRHYLSFVFLVLSAFFCGLFITSQNSFADETPLYSFDLADYFYDVDGEAHFDDEAFADDTGTHSASFPPASYFVVTTQIRDGLLVRFSANYPPTVYFSSGNSSSPITTSYCYPSTRILGTPPSFYSGNFFVIDEITGNPVMGLKEIDITSEGFGVPSSYFTEFSITAFSSCPSVGGTTPTGNIDITSNGTYDVTNYAQATVNVPAEIIQGDYHDDLVAINNSILICAAVCLVIYFFYCIYRLIIKNSGVH